MAGKLVSPSGLPWLHPDLHPVILQHLDEPSALATCARVCKDWDGHCMKLLWQGSDELGDERWRTPAIDMLAVLARLYPERLSKNLEKADSLYLRTAADQDLLSLFSMDSRKAQEQQDIAAIISLLDSGVLRSAQIRASIVVVSILGSAGLSGLAGGHVREPSDTRIPELQNALTIHCLNQRITDLTIISTPNKRIPTKELEFLIKELEGLIIKRCPNLEKFHMLGYREGPVRDSCIRLLGIMPELQDIYLPWIDSTSSEEACRASVMIAHHPKLTEVAMPMHRLGPDDLDPILKPTDCKPFANMRCLDLHAVEPAIFQKLTHHLQSLRSVSVILPEEGISGPDVEEMVFGSITQLHNLVELKVKLRSDISTLASSIFLQVAQSCPLMRSVCLTTELDHEIRMRVAEADIQHIASCFSELERFAVDLAFDIVDCPFLSSLGEETLTRPPPLEDLEETFETILYDVLPNLRFMSVAESQAFIDGSAKPVGLEEFLHELGRYVESMQYIIGPLSDDVSRSLTKERRRQRRLGGMV